MRVPSLSPRARRHLTASLCVLGTAVTFGCGSEPGATGAATVADTAGAGDGGQLQDAVGADTSGDAASDAIAAPDLGADAAASDAVADALADAVEDSAASSDSAADVGSDGATAPDAKADASDIATNDAGNPLYCGKVCAGDELCKDGVCVANKPPCGGACASGLYCDLPTGFCMKSLCKLPSDLGPAQKVSLLTIAESSDGCDHNGDGKPDNVFGKLLKVYPAANTQLQQSINDSLFVLVLDAAGWNYEAKPFSVRFWLAEFDSTSSGCSPTSPDANCKYTVDDDNFAGGPAGICQAQATVKPMTILGVKGNPKGTGILSGGGDLTQKMTIVLPIVGGLDFTMAGVQIDQAAVDGPNAWSQTTQGRICGVMTVKDFDKALASIPADAWAELGLDPATIQAIVKAFLNPDVDLNKDGVPDALSVALRFNSVPGQIVGVTF